MDVLNALRKWKPDEVHDHAVRGQYSAGWMLGKEVKGYREEKGVDKISVIETFVAVQFFVDNWRWKDIPFYIRTGKYLSEKPLLSPSSLNRRLIMPSPKKQHKPGGQIA